MPYDYELLQLLILHILYLIAKIIVLPKHLVIRWKEVALAQWTERDGVDQYYAINQYYRFYYKMKLYVHNVGNCRP